MMNYATSTHNVTITNVGVQVTQSKKRTWSASPPPKTQIRTAKQRKISSSEST